MLLAIVIAFYSVCTIGVVTLLTRAWKPLYQWGKPLTVPGRIEWVEIPFVFEYADGSVGRV